MRTFSKWIPLVLVGFTFLVQMVVWWLGAAHHYGEHAQIMDSAGNKFGFNDDVTLELLSQAAPGVTFYGILDQINVLDCYLWIGMAGGIAFSLPYSWNRLYQWRHRYFVVQLMFYPTGWIGVLMLFFMGVQVMATGGLEIDGETITESFFVVAHGVWVTASLYYVGLSFLTNKLVRGVNRSVSAPVAGSADI